MTRSDNKKGRPKTSFSIVISKPSILPEALFEIEHFVLDALRFVEGVNLVSVGVDVAVLNVLFLDDVAIEDTFLPDFVVGATLRRVVAVEGKRLGQHITRVLVRNPANL